MEYLWAFLIIIGFWALTTFLSSFLGLIVVSIYLILGFIFGTESIIIGLGGLLGNVINLIFTNKYINTHGTMSHAPRYSKIASIGFIFVFIITLILKYAFNLEISNFNYWYLLIIAFIAWIVIKIAMKNQNTESIENFKESVLKFKIVEKYDDYPRWATYLYFKNGKEGWNQTIPGSFRAKDPKNDLTFVFATKEEALEYAQGTFINAEYINEE